jgi:xylulokinase
MAERNILAIDVGTSEIKAAFVSHIGQVQECASCPMPLLHPEPTWAEQDPEVWWSTIREATARLWARVEDRQIEVSSVVFSCQMFGVLPVDKAGKPLANAMIWLDTRSREQARRIMHGFPKISGYGVRKLIKWLRETNGAPNLAGRDTISKFIWLREERPEIWERTHKLLDVKDYLVYRCTGEMVTTHDLASGGWLYRTKKGELGWAKPILDLLDFDVEKLPRVVASTDIVGTLNAGPASDLGVSAGIPVVAGAGDVPSSAVGSGAVRSREAHMSLGTSSWVAAHLDDRAVNPLKATGTLCAAEAGKYLLIATQETAGASLEWTRSKLMGGDLDYPAVNALVGETEPGANGVHFFPWMMGERVPVDDSSIRGGFVNLSLDHERGHLLRAVLEGVAFNNLWALGAVEGLLKQRADTLRITGGGAQSEHWCQIIADVLDRPIERVANPQFTGVRGAALIALYALGEISEFAQTGDLVRVTDVFEPRSEYTGLYADRYLAYLDYYKRTHTWFRRLNEGRSRK